MAAINRQWLLGRRPRGRLSTEDFTYREGALPEIELAAGEILVRNAVLLCAPTMRNWMDPPGNSLYPSIPLGSPVMAPAVAHVVGSADRRFPVGSRVYTISSWQDYQVIPTAQLPVVALQDGLTFVESLGRFGLNSLTAYFGLLEVGRPQTGETLVVSAAAGATGSVAAQIGRIKGCRVIGIAGGPDKCDWLMRECRLDAVIDYKSEDVARRLAELCPQGIDVFFDNVGGAILQAAIDHMAKFGRIVLCGQIDSYDGGGSPEGPRNMMRLIYGSITMQGFLCGNYTARFPAAIGELRAWAAAGELSLREDVREGFAALPATFMDLFAGRNAGTLMVRINDDLAPGG